MASAVWPAGATRVSRLISTAHAASTSTVKPAATGSAAVTTTLSGGQTALTDGGASVALTNASAVTSTWYLVRVHAPGQALLPATATGTVMYTTGTLPTLPSGPYVLTLRQVVMEPGGRGAAHKHSGVEILCALQGTVKMALAGQAPMTLEVGQGMYHLPNTAVQEFNAGSGTAGMMVLLITAQGLPLRRDIDAVP